jgi:putative flavoprotein involved in K+ transport
MNVANSAVAAAVVEAPAAQSEKALVEQWLDKLNAALHSASAPSLASLFMPDGHWRDLFAFTWSITPCQGADAIAALMAAKQATAKARGFAIAQDRTPPRRVKRTGHDLIEGIFQYETEIGRGYGVVRLLAKEPSKAFQLMTNLHELKGFEEKVGKRRPTGEAYSRNFGGTNWKDLRTASEAYTDREPTVLVVGGGQAGLTVAARLRHLGVDTLVIDRLPRVGDCWRTRYHSLALHNPTDYNHLPYMPFPPNWPVYLSKDMVADWFEAYAWAQEINFWTSTELASGTYDESTGRWNAVVRHADGTERTVRPKHLIFANGLVGFPQIPELPGLKDFKGEVMHTTAYSNGAEWRGKNALVVGTGTSAHDVAQDLHANGADATIVQRGSTMVLSIDPAAKLSYGLYEGVALEDGDLLVTTNSLPVLETNLRMITARMVDMDRKMIDGLIARGFKWHDGEDHAGHNMMIRRRYGGYYLNAGCSELIINGEVGLLQYEKIERFAPDGALLTDGSLKPADLIVLATGFVSQEVLVGKLLGEAVAKKVGPVWGLAPDGEMNNMWKRTAQEGLWFVGGSFANCRIFSRFVALQIKAVEEGLLSKRV